MADLGAAYVRLIFQSAQTRSYQRNLSYLVFEAKGGPDRHLIYITEGKYANVIAGQLERNFHHHIPSE